MRAYSRLQEALLSKLTSWRMIPLTCHPSHSLHVTMAWTWEVRFSFLFLPPLLSLRNLQQSKALLKNPIGKERIKKCAWQQSSSAVSLARTPVPDAGHPRPQPVSSLLGGSSWSAWSSVHWLLLFFFFNMDAAATRIQPDISCPGSQENCAWPVPRICAWLWIFVVQLWDVIFC